MKICWDNLEKLNYNTNDCLFRSSVRRIRRNGKKHTLTLVFVLINCLYCGEEGLVRWRYEGNKGKHISRFCCNECLSNYRRKSKEDHLAWRRAWEKSYIEKNRKSYNMRKNNNQTKFRKEHYDLYKERWARGYIKRRPKILLQSIKRRSKGKGLEFNLDLEWMLEKFNNGICEMSGLPFDLNSIGNAFNPSVDRIDPKKGYTKDNCRLVVAILNFIKMEFSDEDVYKAAAAFVKYYENNNDN